MSGEGVWDGGSSGFPCGVNCSVGDVMGMGRGGPAWDVGSRVGGKCRPGWRVGAGDTRLACEWAGGMRGGAPTALEECPG